MEQLNLAASADIVYIAKFSKSAYNPMSDNDFAAYANNVINKMNGNTVYANFEGLVSDLVRVQEDYIKALQVVIEGGSSPQYVVKREAKIAVILALNAFEYQMNAEANGVVSFITNAGFHCWRKSHKSNSVPPVTPIVISVLANPSVAGVATVILSRPPGTKSAFLVIPYVSTDGGATYTPYKPIPAKGGEIRDLPSGMLLLIKFVAFDNKAEESTPTAPVSVQVL